MTSRVALVTGANRGTGFATCRSLGRLGLRVILTARDRNRGERAAALLRREGLDVTAFLLDVSQARSVGRMTRRVETEFGRLDVLVNNAAVYLDESDRLVDIGERTLRRTIETNLIGAWRMCRAFVPLMQIHGYGRIVNVSSEYGSLAGMETGGGAYRVSKAALNALTRIVADEVDRREIKVNAVCPGWVRTRMGGDDAELDPAEATDTIVWLATLPAGGPTGGFFQERKPLPW
jgi:NAD(P)-dependent dehydrogenase (short-subunit alcohol dehydrogenase family)